MAKPSKYTVTIEGSDAVKATVADGPTAYNTARAIAVAICRVNPGAVVALDRGYTVERYIGEEKPAVAVRRYVPRRARTR